MKCMSNKVESHVVANCVASYVASRLQRCIDAYLVGPCTGEILSCQTKDSNLFNPVQKPSKVTFSMQDVRCMYLPAKEQDLNCNYRAS